MSRCKKFCHSDLNDWFIGSKESPERKWYSSDTWVKWGRHEKGHTSGGEGVSGKQANWKMVSGHQLSIVLKGQITIWVRDCKGAPHEEHAVREGEALWIAHGVGHRWRVDVDCTKVLTIRWQPEEPPAHS